MFNNCRNPKTNAMLRFDFYLIDYNICIEYDGSQHFRPFNFVTLELTANDTLVENQYRDGLKNIFCDGIDERPILLRIPYWDFKNIEKILTAYLLVHKVITL